MDWEKLEGTPDLPDRDNSSGDGTHQMTVLPSIIFKVHLEWPQDS